MLNALRLLAVAIIWILKISSLPKLYHGFEFCTQTLHAINQNHPNEYFKCN